MTISELQGGYSSVTEHVKAQQEWSTVAPASHLQRTEKSNGRDGWLTLARDPGRFVVSRGFSGADATRGEADCTIGLAPPSDL